MMRRNEVKRGMTVSLGISFLQFSMIQAFVPKNYPHTFLPTGAILPKKINVLPMSESTSSSETKELDPSICEQMSIHVCASTSCSKKRKILGMDEFATFGAMYERAGSTGVSVEESTCLGSCKLAPCVAIQHEDYMGNIGLEGMTENELSLRLFHNIVSEGDCDRIWGCVENAVRIMAEEEEEEKEEDDDGGDYQEEDNFV